MKTYPILLNILLAAAAAAPAQNRWTLADTCAIEWLPQASPHADHIEMSGKRISVVYRYRIDGDGSFHVNRSVVWPLLRTVPNNTHASLTRRFDWNPLDVIRVNGQPVKKEKVTAVRLDGTLGVESLLDWGSGRSARLSRRFFPSTHLPVAIEQYRLVNTGQSALSVELPHTFISYSTDPQRGVDGSYSLRIASDRAGFFRLAPADTLTFSTFIEGYKQGEELRSVRSGEELALRRNMLAELSGNLILETPDSVLNTMFAFSKIRACESIYETAGGPMHGPGGEAFYAAIWANDQAEYINPYFPFTGYRYGCESALNSFRHFARFMNDCWAPIPSSIIAEGKDIWNGAGDRGDAAMIAYGAARYALARGNRDEARQLWPLIEWCLEYCRRQLTPEGVVASDSDELEGRFPAGKANLCTSSLYYDALQSAAFLARELGGKGSLPATYEKQAARLRKNIGRYFGSRVEGFDTYAYYKGNDVLRAWICIPLTVGITERSRGTIEALFSPRLWTENGLLTQAGDKTFWDRSTLYALRGVYQAGETERATDYLRRYSARRLLGDHVPYAIEAWPEGGQRHLSAESGLYGRIVTEGLFGIRPTGFRSFTLTPRLPAGWNTMRLRRICAFENRFDIAVSRTKGGKIRIRVTADNRTLADRTVRDGQPVAVHLLP